MHLDCIHMEYWPGTYYDPPEASCKLDRYEDCENCPFYSNKEDYECELYDDSLDF